jgi:hypothetical protein
VPLTVRTAKTSRVRGGLPVMWRRASAGGFFDGASPSAEHMCRDEDAPPSLLQGLDALLLRVLSI